MARITSRIKVLVDGDELLNKTGWTFNPGGINRTTVNGDQKTHGYTEEIMNAQVTGDISHTEAQDLVALGDIENATIVIETNSGQSYVIRGAWLTEPGALNTSEGGVTLTFEGPKAERM